MLVMSTSSTKIAIRLSETRSRLNTLQTRDDALTDAETRERDDLSAKLETAETEYRAALQAETETTEVTTTSTTDPETRARLELRSRTGIADFLRAAATGAEVQGAAREYAQAVGVPVHGRLPLACFPDAPGALETRAITSGPAVDGPAQPTVPFVFERTAAAAVGVQFVTVGSGQVQVPAVTTAPPADTLAKDAAAPSTAAAISLVSREPKRISGAFEVRVEDLAVMPELESVLQDAIRSAIGNETDAQVFNGTGSGGDLSGLFKTATDVAIAGATETYASGIARYAALVDGRHAYGLADVHAVIGPATYAALMGLFASNGSVPLADYLLNMLGSFRVSDRMPTKSGDGQKGIAVLGASGDPIRCYVWDSLAIIRDPYSGASAGKVTITASALVSDLFIPHGTAQVVETHPKIS